MEGGWYRFWLVFLLWVGKESISPFLFRFLCERKYTNYKKQEGQSTDFGGLRDFLFHVFLIFIQSFPHFLFFFLFFLVIITFTLFTP